MDYFLYISCIISADNLNCDCCDKNCPCLDTSQFSINSLILHDNSGYPSGKSYKLVEDKYICAKKRYLEKRWCKKSKIKEMNGTDIDLILPDRKRRVEIDMQKYTIDFLASSIIDINMNQERSHDVRRNFDKSMVDMALLNASFFVIINFNMFYGVLSPTDGRDTAGLFRHYKQFVMLMLKNMKDKEIKNQREQHVNFYRQRFSNSTRNMAELSRLIPRGFTGLKVDFQAGEFETKNILMHLAFLIKIIQSFLKLDICYDKTGNEIVEQYLEELAYFIKTQGNITLELCPIHENKWKDQINNIYYLIDIKNILEEYCKEKELFLAGYAG